MIDIALYGQKKTKGKVSSDITYRTFCLEHKELAISNGLKLLKRLKLKPYIGIYACKIYKGLMLETFWKWGNYSKPGNPVESKTDIALFSADDKVIKRISVKYGQKSQAASMAPNELKCITYNMDILPGCLDRMLDLVGGLYSYTGQAKNQDK